MKSRYISSKYIFSQMPTVPSPMTIFTAFKIRGELLHYSSVDDSMFQHLYSISFMLDLLKKKKKKPTHTGDDLLRLLYNCSTRYLSQKYSNFTSIQIYDSVGLGWDPRIYLSNNFPDDVNVPSLRILPRQVYVTQSLWPHGLYSPWDSPGQDTGMGSLSLLQRIFLTQESNWGILHCRRFLYQLSYQGSPLSSTMER